MTSRLPPATRRDFIRFLSERGWDGPRPGVNHDFMIKGRHWQAIPSSREIPTPILQQAGYTRQDWLGR